ncbi:MAG: hypothetical protein B9S38_12215 [Verrucomicrobiia bacterium Tous-C4TDCM]|nr:MAG: hypothetical protein B9S38_12215 [Verrucomicrobiae bacterium Tous-C4TDCM]
MQKLELSRDLRELLKCFHSHEVRFLVVGGHAVSYHGYPRFTKDLDVWVEPTESNALLVMAALRDYGLDYPGLETDMFTGEGRMTQMGVEPNRVDILNRIKGVDFQQCYERKSFVPVDDTNIPIISKDDLILNKIATGRPQDLADADYLQNPPPK